MPGVCGLNNARSAPYPQDQHCRKGSFMGICDRTGVLVCQWEVSYADI